MVKNRLDTVLASEKKLLSIFLTAGFPRPGDTVPLLETLERSGVDLVEVGFPFSDPLADGPTIQHSNEVAIKGGMTLVQLFKDLKAVRERVSMPLLLMGYINPVLQFGVQKFCEACKQVGIDGVIIPDLPLAEYIRDYKKIFEGNNLHVVFLITPSTSEERIRALDECSTTFIYAVSSAAVTGTNLVMNQSREDYLKRIEKLNLRHPVMVGFGINDKTTFNQAASHAKGAIIGSAFIKHLGGSKDPIVAAKEFVSSLR